MYLQALNKTTMLRLFIALILSVLFIPVFSQSKAKPIPTNTITGVNELLQGLTYRNIGPARGGRSTAVAGFTTMPYTFLMGATGGGVWRTDDGGTTWRNISDGQIPVGSIGAIAVAPSDENVIYVGTGSADPRGNVSIGKGIYVSRDQGKTWSFSGLEKAGQIGRIEVHPQHAHIAYAAVLGNPFGPTKERGVYKTTDGGKTWNQILYLSDKTGVIDVSLDKNNPRILLAAAWTFQRKPWTTIDGSEEGGVYHSTDEGVTWKKLNNGLPNGVLGKIGVAISPANSQRIWVLAEAAVNEKGGLYRSDDGGKNFTRINGDRELRTRHWYYTRIFADPKDEETVYVNNVSFWKSTNAGLHFDRISVTHGDCHDLWINPDDNRIMIHSNDGGAHVSYTGGKSWSTLQNQPTAEIYRVAVDNAFPYRVYGCQQDNTSISVSSAVRGGTAYQMDWLHVGGGEAGHVAVNHENANIIYAGEYTGILTRYDRAAEHMQYVTHYPQMHDGLPLYEVKYRFQWNAPIRVSPHDANIVYHCSQFVHRSTDGGLNWEVISPDLTTNTKAYQEIPGGPVQHDYTGVENYTTIFAFEESPIEKGLLVAGSDDGLLHISTDAGKNWNKLILPGLPALATINSIDFSKHTKGKILVTAHNYRLNDFKPYIFQTTDYGKTWKLITSGIPADFPTRVAREDSNVPGILYAGTEFGMFVSLNDGATWQSFQLNLPNVPITDLLIKNKDLVISTQGRSFWILDNLQPLYELSAKRELQLMQPSVAYRTQLGGFYGPAAPTPSPDGASIDFILPENYDETKKVELHFYDTQNNLIRTYSTHPDEVKRESKLSVKKGFNRFVWNLYTTGPAITPGSYFSMASLQGAKYPSGGYVVSLTYTGTTLKQNGVVKKDPRWKCTDQDLAEAYTLTQKAAKELENVHIWVRKIRSMREQSASILERAKQIGKEKTLQPLKESLDKELTVLEDALIQSKHQAGQDPINYPPKFDDQWAWLVDVINGQDAKPTQGCYDLFNDLKKQSQRYTIQFNQIVNEYLKPFNEEVVKLEVGKVIVDGMR